MGKPKIRFEGYSEDWEQRKLGEVLKLENGYAFKSQFFSDNETNIIVATPGNVSVDGGFIEEGGKYYKIDGEIPDAYIFHPGDLFVTMTDLTPTANTLGKPATVPDNGVMYLHNQRLGKLIGFEGDKAFLYSLLCTSEYHNYMVVTASGSTVRHSSPGRILEYEIAIPGLDEQIKIGKYFSNLDHLITLHQRKCDEIKTLKKYMLQKMFSQNGEKVPEIRFNGFTEDWEQRKLGDITTKIGSGKTPKGGAAAYKDDGIALIRSQNVNGDRVDLSDVVFIDEQTDEDMKNSRVLKGDVLLNITGASIGRSAVFTRELRANVNQHVCIIRTKGSDASPEFIQLNIISSNGQNQIDSFQAGGGREGLNFHQIGKMEFLYPGIEEQQKIGQYFANLDHLITLHQRKCNELKEIKKYMLQNMFV